MKEFGIRNERPQFIAFVFDATAEQLQKIKDIVQGTAASIASDEIRALSSESTIIKHYKLEKTELDVGSLETAVINRIVVRDV